MIVLRFARFILYPLLLALLALPLAAQDSTAPTGLPNGRLLGEVPGHPRDINNLPTAAAVSPDGRFVVFLHSGFVAYTAKGQQSLSVLDVETNELSDFPDDRLGHNARQTYFLGLAFALDGKHLYASMASYTDPLGKTEGSTGNGIAVYAFEEGKIAPETFLPLSPRTSIPGRKVRRDEFKDVTYPAGLSIGRVGGQESILVACNNSDEAILLHTSDGKIIHRFDLSTFKRIPASLPYTTVITNDGTRGFVSLWNASTVAQLDLLRGKVVGKIALQKPRKALTGVAPTALCSITTTQLYLWRSPIATRSWPSTPNENSILSVTKPAQHPTAAATRNHWHSRLMKNSYLQRDGSVGVFDLTQRQPDHSYWWYPTVVAIFPRIAHASAGAARTESPTCRHQKGGASSIQRLDRLMALSISKFRNLETYSKKSPS
jgi:hypothetical protein